MHRQVGGSGGNGQHVFTHDDDFIIGTDIDQLNGEGLDEDASTFLDEIDIINRERQTLINLYTQLIQ